MFQKRPWNHPMPTGKHGLLLLRVQQYYAFYMLTPLSSFLPKHKRTHTFLVSSFSLLHTLTLTHTHTHTHTHSSKLNQVTPGLSHSCPIGKKSPVSGHRAFKDLCPRPVQPQRVECCPYSLISIYIITIFYFQYPMYPKSRSRIQR